MKEDASTLTWAQNDKQQSELLAQIAGDLRNGNSVQKTETQESSSTSSKTAGGQGDKNNALEGRSYKTKISGDELDSLPSGYHVEELGEPEPALSDAELLADAKRELEASEFQDKIAQALARGERLQVKVKRTNGNIEDDWFVGGWNSRSGSYDVLKPEGEGSKKFLHKPATLADLIRWEGMLVTGSVPVEVVTPKPPSLDSVAEGGKSAIETTETETDDEKAERLRQKLVKDGLVADRDPNAPVSDAGQDEESLKDKQRKELSKSRKDDRDMEALRRNQFREMATNRLEAGLRRLRDLQKNLDTLPDGAPQIQQTTLIDAIAKHRQNELLPQYREVLSNYAGHKPEELGDVDRRLLEDVRQNIEEIEGEVAMAEVEVMREVGRERSRAIHTTLKRGIYEIRVRTFQETQSPAPELSAELQGKIDEVLERTLALTIEIQREGMEGTLSHGDAGVQREIIAVANTKLYELTKEAQLLKHKAAVEIQRVSQMSKLESAGKWTKEFVIKSAERYRDLKPRSLKLIIAAGLGITTVGGAAMGGATGWAIFTAGFTTKRVLGTISAYFLTSAVVKWDQKRVAAKTGRELDDSDEKRRIILAGAMAIAVGMLPMMDSADAMSSSEATANKLGSVMTSISDWWSGAGTVAEGASGVVVDLTNPGSVVDNLPPTTYAEAMRDVNENNSLARMFGDSMKPGSGGVFEPLPPEAESIVSDTGGSGAVDLDQARMDTGFGDLPLPSVAPDAGSPILETVTDMPVEEQPVVAPTPPEMPQSAPVGAETVVDAQDGASAESGATESQAITTEASTASQEVAPTPEYKEFAPASDKWGGLREQIKAYAEANHIELPSEKGVNNMIGNMLAHPGENYNGDQMKDIFGRAGERFGMMGEAVEGSAPNVEISYTDLPPEGEESTVPVVPEAVGGAETAVSEPQTVSEMLSEKTAETYKDGRSMLESLQSAGAEHFRNLPEGLASADTADKVKYFMDKDLGAIFNPNDVLNGDWQEKSKLWNDAKGLLANKIGEVSGSNVITHPFKLLNGFVNKMIELGQIPGDSETMEAFAKRAIGNLAEGRS
ncbi:MAG: hypothetical protein COV07_03605 [Candidatus Vogelbacteria bacterium CG10_big_fil_rev_8_21_14_0_10_45_14]|uniref:Uncharacterized protein n=1 Tax=Candidatus Vogelbacteria bacterium CG10_big_fil_rev_8_21_14_0_10_45_14 TaxID=1975042 RepID=A0A2H0RKM5_9BACT|nr:MAG: hypothetical protein COV07_03605 [Candidatus Vogelbacteria bacterium CG10_big_fil_rev_8_21_14_0_10_45_14]